MSELVCPGCGLKISIKVEPEAAKRGLALLLVLDKGWRPVAGGVTKLVCSSTCRDAVRARMKLPREGGGPLR